MNGSHSSSISRALSNLWGGNGSTNGSSDEEDLSSQAQSCFMSLVSACAAKPKMKIRSRKERILGFFVCLALGVLCFALALALTPMILLKAKKFAVLFTLGSVFTLGSFSFLWGPWSHVKHLCSRDRLPFTAVYLITIVATLYCALKMHSTVLTLIFAIAQIIALVWFLMSYIPGGTTGLTFMVKLVTQLCSRTVSQAVDA